MRRIDREITDEEELLEIIGRCDVLRLALNDEEVPYIIPLNFGMRIEKGKVIFYFHGAREGKKHELIGKDSRASFELDCCHELFTDEEEMSCSMAYESVIGRGSIDYVPEEETEDALDVLMGHYHKEEFPYKKSVIPKTCCYKLTVEEMTGKRRRKKEEVRRNVRLPPAG